MSVNIKITDEQLNEVFDDVARATQRPDAEH